MDTCPSPPPSTTPPDPAIRDATQSSQQHDTTPVLYYNSGVAIYYTDSADKHQIEGRRGDITFVFVGKRHELSRGFLEVMVALRPSGRLEVFHAMELTDQWRWLLYAPGHTQWEE